MNTIKQLIEKYCPNGVEYKKLGEIGTFYSGLSGKSKDDFKDGNAKFITYMNVYSNPSTNLDVIEKVKICPSEKQNKIEKGDILFTGSSETPDECGMSSVVTEDVTSDYYLNSFCFGFRLNDKNTFDFGFLKHLFRDKNTRAQIARTANGVTRYNVSKKLFSRILIPVPPLPVQREIVRILDNFTSLEAELEAELEARRKQYEYYRDQLLSFKHLSGGGKSDVEWKTLGEVFEMRNGYTPSKSHPDFWEGGSIPWFRMEDIRTNGRRLSDSILHITDKGIKGKGLFEKGTFILATTATIGEHALLIVDSLANQQFTNLKIRKSLTSSLSVDFVFYYMFVVDEFCKKHTNKSGFESVDMRELNKMPFPIPPLSVQRRIVSILDRFESLVNDITTGLPAEIAARHQQYEYYRDQLLTFKRKS